MKIFGQTATWASVLLGTLLSFSQAAEKQPGPKNRDAKPSKITENIFTNTAVPRIRIEIGASKMAVLRQYRWNWGGNSYERSNVPVTVREGQMVYTNVALHLKGAAGSFRPVDQNPALTLNFDKFAPGQRFHGLQKIHLNNSIQDQSLLSEQISRELFEAAGVPVPRAANAQVELNGRYLGVYVMVEGWNKQFLRRYFKNTKGNLYDGGFVKDIDQDLATNSGENPKNQSDREALVAAAQEPDPAVRLARLEKILDLDRFISMIAMEVILCHWDGYAMNKNNYRLYHDLDTDRMVFMPHGLDQMFGVMRANPNLPIFPHMKGLVALSVLQTPEGQRRYKDRLTDLSAKVFKVDAVVNRVNELAARIRPVLAERNPQYANYHEREVTELIRRITQRGQSLQEQLSASSRALKFNNAGIVRLSGWTSRSDFGKPKFEQMKNIEGKTLLHISAAQGSSVGCWRIKVPLEGGRYRIEARVKTEGVVPDPGDDRRGGAGLRTFGTRFTQKLVGDHEWTNIGHEFDMPEGMAEVELICELRAGKGQVWFDASSLRLIRK
jgi:hypothetical protein